MVDHVKETDKKSDVESPKVADNVSSEVNARGGIDDLTKKATEYYKQRRQGLTDSVTGKMVADGGLPAKPEFYDSAAEAKEAPTKGDSKAAAPVDKAEKQKQDVKQFADDFADAQKTGDYSKAIKEFNELTRNGPTGELGKAVNDELHKRGLLPESLTVNPGVNAALLGHDVPGIPIYNTETKESSVYDAKGKELAEKDIGNISNFSQLSGDIKSEIDKETIKAGADYATKHFDEIDKRQDGHISRKDIDKYIEEKGSSIAADDKKALEYMRDNMKEVRNTVDDKGLDVRGATKNDLQEYNKEKGREAPPEKPPEPPKPKAEIEQRTTSDILDKRGVGITDPFMQEKEVAVEIKPGDDLDKFAEAAIKRAKGANYKPDEDEVSKQIADIIKANPDVKFHLDADHKLKIKEAVDIVVPIPRE
jgi:hypothetical protein